MIGRKFGLLTVRKLSDKSTSRRLIYVCDCDCGTQNVEVNGDKLRSGWTKSCGCLVKKRASEIHKKYNKYDMSGNYGIGFTSNTDREFYFDIEDYEKINQYCWLELQNGYIATSHNDGSFTYLHRLVMDVMDDNVVVDHIKHHLYDNRKSELRIGSQSTNMMNATIREDNTSGFTGVYWHSKNHNWVADIFKEGKKVCLGSFVSEDDAINARIEAENNYFGSWSYKNSNGKFNYE